MDCGTFRDNHAAYVDGVVGGGDLVAMQGHVSSCGSCAAHDTAVRRALLLFRNMPTIMPSSDFSVRLHARLRQARAERRRGAAAWRGSGSGSYQGPGVRTFTALAAGLIAAGYVAVSAFDHVAPGRTLALAPVVATATADDPDDDAPADADADVMTSLATPAFVASVSTGIPVWPATALAARAPARIAAAQLKLTSLGR
jgi:hypothetical protein